MVNRGPRFDGAKLDLTALNGNDQPIGAEVAGAAADRRERRRLARFAEVEAVGGEFGVHTAAEDAIRIAHRQYREAESLRRRLFMGRLIPRSYFNDRLDPDRQFFDLFTVRFRLLLDGRWHRLRPRGGAFPRRLGGAGGGRGGWVRQRDEFLQT